MSMRLFLTTYIFNYGRQVCRKTVKTTKRTTVKSRIFQSMRRSLSFKTYTRESVTYNSSLSLLSDFSLPFIINEIYFG